MNRIENDGFMRVILLQMRQAGGHMHQAIRRNHRLLSSGAPFCATSDDQQEFRECILELANKSWAMPALENYDSVVRQRYHFRTYHAFFRRERFRAIASMGMPTRFFAGQHKAQFAVQKG